MESRNSTNFNQINYDIVNFSQNVHYNGKILTNKCEVIRRRVLPLISVSFMIFFKDNNDFENIQHMNDENDIKLRL